MQVTAKVSEQQHGSGLLPETDPLLCNERGLASTCTDENAEAASPVGADHASGSRLAQLPTEQEIKHMDELDLSINLGSLLGPGENWIVDDTDHFASLNGGADQSNPMVEPACANTLGGRPFQELFPVA